MNEDIELIGYGVKTGNNYVSGEDKDFSFFRSFRNGMFVSKKVVKCFQTLMMRRKLLITLAERL